MAEGKEVRLEFDWQKKDKYGRILAYVYLPDGTFLNAEIIKQGYGFAYTKHPYRYLEDFRKIPQRWRLNRNVTKEITVKKVALLIIVVLLSMTTGCKGNNYSPSERISFTGTVVWKTLETGFYAIDSDDGQGYEPINLPREFRSSGLRVRVSAKIRNDMASINMYGTIIEIIEISKLR